MNTGKCFLKIRAESAAINVTYKDFNKTSQTYYERKLIAPAIDKISLQEFADGITNSKSVMPSYFLTQDEIIILYKYIKKIGIKDEK